jgi:hypothetical protein
LVSLRGAWHMLLFGLRTTMRLLKKSGRYVRSVGARARAGADYALRNRTVNAQASHWPGMPRRNLAAWPFRFPGPQYCILSILGDGLRLLREERMARPIRCRADTVSHEAERTS